MRHFNIKNEMAMINYQRLTLNKFSNQAGIIIQKLHAEFNQPAINLVTHDIFNNSFEFLFLGFTIIIKTEISFDSEKKGFVQGELNSYVKNKEIFDMLLSYPFDSIGNIGHGAVLEDFSTFYYVELMSSLIDYSINSGVKFKL